MNKRHAKPTTMQLTARIYRRLLEVQSNQADIGDIVVNVNEELSDIRGEMRSALAMLSERLESFRDEFAAFRVSADMRQDTLRTLTDHCVRLLREKETLMRMHQANDFMAEAPRDFTTADMSVKCYEHPVARAAGWGCGFKLLHRVGVRCAVCGELEMPNAFQEGHNNDAH